MELNKLRTHAPTNGILGVTQQRRSLVLFLIIQTLQELRRHGCREFIKQPHPIFRIQGQENIGGVVLLKACSKSLCDAGLNDSNTS